MGNRLLTALAFIAFFSVMTAGCSGLPAEPVAIETNADGEYAGFQYIPAVYTPDTAAEEGCMVVVAENADDVGTLYAGESVFGEFLAACKRGDAFMRVAYFIGETASYGDLFYKDGKYCYIESESADDIEFYSKLRELKTMFGNPEREYTCYALTGSDELTADDVLWSFLSSDLNTVTDIPFKWLGFTTYLDTADKNPSEITSENSQYDNY